MFPCCSVSVTGSNTIESCYKHAVPGTDSRWRRRSWDWRKVGMEHTHPDPASFTPIVLCSMRVFVFLQRDEQPIINRTFSFFTIGPVFHCLHAHRSMIDLPIIAMVTVFSSCAICHVLQTQKTFRRPERRSVVTVRTGVCVHVCVRTCVCVRACVRAYQRACVCVCSVCVCVCLNVHVPKVCFVHFSLHTCT